MTLSESRSGPPVWPVRLTVALLLFVVYLISGSGAFHIIDEVSLFSVTENVVRRGDWDTDQIAWSQWVNSPAEVLGAWGQDGHVYSKKGPAPVLAFIPLRWLAARLPGAGLLQTTFLSNALITILTALVLWGLARRLGYSEALGAAAALIYGLGTLAWPYATHLFGEPLSALSLTLSLWALLAFRQHPRHRYLILMGLAWGAMVASTAVYVLFLPLFAIVWWLIEHRYRRRWPLFSHWLALGAPLILWAGGLFAYNWLRFGSIWTTGYHFSTGEGFSTPIWLGAYGLLISPYRGLIYHQPLTLAAVAGLPLFWRRHRQMGALTLSVVLALILAFSAWWMWWGGFAWGPRFLTPLAPIFILWLLPLLRVWRHWLLGLLLALSTLVQLLAVSVNYVLWEIELRSIYPTDWQNPLRYGPPAMLNPLHSPVLGQLRLLRSHPWAEVLDFAWFQPGHVVLWTPLAGLGIIMLAAGGLAYWRRHGQLAMKTPLALLALTLIFSYASLRAFAQDPRYGQADVGYRAILSEIEQHERPDEAIVTVAPYHYHIPMNHYHGRLPILGFSQEQPLHPQTARLLRQTLTETSGLYLITAGLPPADPSNGVELWLNEHAYLADDRWFDDFRLLRYGSVAATQALPVDAVWGDPPALSMDFARISGPNLIPGDFLDLELNWAARETGPNWHLFIQLAVPGQAPVAQYDRQFDTGAWQPHSQHLIRAALWTPPTIPPGAYALLLGWYDPATGQRIPVAGSDTYSLTTIQVLPRSNGASP